MSMLQVFQFEEKQVRTVDIDGQPWFVAMDVCDVLEIGNSRMAVSRLDGDERDDVTITDAIGREQTATAVNESGLYSLILKSRKDAAKKFKKWITSEVLPSIRKTGSYQVTSQLPGSFAEALKLAYEQQLQIDQSAALVATLKQEQAILLPKADFFDQVTGSDTAIDIGTAAKVLNMGIGRTKLLEFLRGVEILRGNNQPYQKHIDAGHFRVIEQSWQRPDGSAQISFKTVVYQKGLALIRKRLVDAGYGQPRTAA